MKHIHHKIFLRPIIWILGVVSFFTLCGCTKVGPDYIKPDLSMPQKWHSPAKDGLKTGEQDPQALASWWNTLNDPELSSLMERAVVQNLDLKIAAARIREARARRGIANAELYPTIDASGQASRNRTSEKVGDGTASDLYSAGFDAAWELDIFGGARRSVEAADASLQSNEEGLHDVLVSLLAEIALNYLDIRTYQARLAVMEANLKAQNETLQLATWRYQAGLTDELAVQQALSNSETTRSQIPPLRTGLEEAANRLAVLMGEKPGTVHSEIMTQKPIPVTPTDIVIGVPADILRQRPDVRKAERNLAAQTAQVGAVTAELYPKFTLNGSIGLEALSLGSLFSSGSHTDSESAIISWRILDAGSIRENIKAQSALQEQSFFAYETAVLGALEEVENALVAFAEEQNRRQSLVIATQAAQRAADFSRNNFQAGLIDFSDVLIAERSVLSLQVELAQSEGNITRNVVRLYKALGGGWTALGTENLKNR